MIAVEQPQHSAALVGPAPPLRAAQRQQLLEEHLPEVRYIARRIHGHLPPHVQLDDLVHDGVLGLIDAIDKFDPLKQVQLKSYAKFRIRGAILDSLRAGDWSPRSLRRQARQLQETRREMSAAFGRPPADAELAVQLQMDLPAFQQLLAKIEGLDLTSLQADFDDVSPEATSARHRDSAADPFSLCLRAEMKSHLVCAMHTLDLRERQVLALYYGGELTMREVGAALGIGESRVSQIHTIAMTRLRGRLQSRLRSGAAA